MTHASDVAGAPMQHRWKSQADGGSNLAGLCSFILRRKVVALCPREIPNPCGVAENSPEQ